MAEIDAETVAKVRLLIFSLVHLARSARQIASCTVDTVPETFLGRTRRLVALENYAQQRSRALESDFPRRLKDAVWKSAELTRRTRHDVQFLSDVAYP